MFFLLVSRHLSHDSVVCPCGFHNITFLLCCVPLQVWHEMFENTMVSLQSTRNIQTRFINRVFVLCCVPMQVWHTMFENRRISQQKHKEHTDQSLCFLLVSRRLSHDSVVCLCGFHNGAFLLCGVPMQVWHPMLENTRIPIQILLTSDEFQARPAPGRLRRWFSIANLFKSILTTDEFQARPAPGRLQRWFSIGFLFKSYFKSDEFQARTSPALVFYCVPIKSC